MLKGTVIHLIQSEDDKSTTSDMDASDSTLPQDHFEADPLNLTQEGPEWEEGELSEQSSSPDTMDQHDVLGRDTYLNGGLASNTGVASGRITDFQSEDMDTTAQPSGAERWKARMCGMPVAVLTPTGAKERMRRLSVIACTLRYGPTLSLSHRGVTMGGTKRKI